MSEAARRSPKEILAAEQASPCPYGLVRASDDEINVVADALRRHSDFLLSDNAAHNLAYRALVALRAKHFEWWARVGGGK